MYEYLRLNRYGQSDISLAAKVFLVYVVAEVTDLGAWSYISSFPGIEEKLSDVGAASGSGYFIRTRSPVHCYSLFSSMMAA